MGGRIHHLDPDSAHTHTEREIISMCHHHHHHQESRIKKMNGEEEEEVAGSVGTSASFGLRLGQALFSSSSLLFMSLGAEFYSYTPFCFLVMVMGLVIPWSFTLAMVDGYSTLVKCPLRHPGILLIVILGDMVLSLLTLAAASSTASVVDLLLQVGDSCPPKFCRRYQISAALAFLSWFLSTASTLFNIWQLPSL